MVLKLSLSVMSSYLNTFFDIYDFYDNSEMIFLHQGFNPQINIYSVLLLRITSIIFSTAIVKALFLDSSAKREILAYEDPPFF